MYMRLQPVQANRWIMIISIQLFRPVLAGTRARSGDRYGSGTLHSRQVLRGSLPLLPSAFRRSNVRPRCLHVPINASDPSSERWNCGREWSVILPKWRLFLRHLGIFYMPQICDMGQTAVLPFRRKACWEFFRPKNLTGSAGSEPAILGTRGQHANH
jgi:hypothetical protein